MGDSEVARELVFGVIGLLLLYLCWQLLRLWLLGRRQRAMEEGPSQAIQSRILGSDEGPSFSAVHFNDQEPVLSELPVEAETPRLHRVAEPDAGAFGFDALMEVRQARHRVDELARRQDAMELELASLRKALAEVRSLTQVSPIYGEAVALARRGYDIEAIAERCGISMAEAQLVSALSKDTEEDTRDDKA
jgi:hypothetical protein